MALKHWKKIGGNEWQHKDNTDLFVDIVEKKKDNVGGRDLYPKGKEAVFVIDDVTTDPKNKYFKTKSEALKAQQKYMRSH